MKTYILMLALVAFGYVMSGCHTAHGFGEDVENAGEEIQKGTR